MLGVIKRFVLVVISLVLLTGGVTYYLLWKGVWGFDDWVVRQVVAIVETYIVPEIRFSDFKYEAPGSIELHDVTLIAPGEIEVVRTDSLRISLAETPRPGHPIVLERISLENPTLRLIRPGPEGRSRGVMFEGLAPFVRTQNIRNQNSLDESVRLSNVLKIRKISMSNGALEYHETGGLPPMLLSGVTMDLSLDPEAAGAAPGWYRLVATLERLPVFDLDIDARVNLDSFESQLKPLRVRVNLGEDTYSTLPPQLQGLLREYDVVGKLEVNLAGDINVNDPMASKLEAGVWIDELDFAAGDYRLPIDEGRFEATLSERTIDFSRGFLELLGGKVTFTTARVLLQDDSWPSMFSWRAQDLQLSELMRTAAPTGQPPYIAGALASTGDATIDIREGRSSIGGKGEVNITKGRFINFDLVQDLMGMMGARGATKKANRFNDTMLAKFDLTPKGIKITSFDMRAQYVAARGKGLLGFDTSIDAELNAGPLEKMQTMLGPIGSAMGAITDQLMKYHVTGTMGDVHLRVRPLGIH